MARAEHIAFVSPRFAEGATVGGAETLLRELARQAQAAGRRVTFLATCAVNHFTWANERPAGCAQREGLEVRSFPVDEDRDAGTFLRIQSTISSGAPVSASDQRLWMKHSVNSRALIEHLEQEGDRYDRIVLGPYLFGLVFHAAQVHPHKSLLVPCLHDEPFAYQAVMREMFDAVAGCLFNTEPEQNLARRLFQLPEDYGRVVGMGLDPFDPPGQAPAGLQGLGAPYVLYCGRREPLKGTPLILDYMETFRERTGTDLKVVFTGSGPVEPSPALAPHVVDLGFVSEDDKQAAMAGATAFIHPSVNESLGIVLLESWLARTPALVHAAGEVLTWQCRSSGGGLWFRNYPEFEEELLLLCRQPELRKAMGEAGRAYVELQYAWPAVRQRLLDALDTPGS